MQAPDQESPDIFERTEEFRPTPEQLSLYAGSYVSDEIEPVYRMVVEHGSLVLRRLKSKPEAFQPAVRDYFEGPEFGLHFLRDSSGKVNGLLLNSGRIKNFRFTKTAASETRP